MRTRRAISWFERAEKAHQTGEPDIAFILYWIAFNAAYASDDLAAENSEKRARQKYFERLLLRDKGETISRAMWDSGLRGPIRELLLTRYLFREYWDHLNGNSPKRGWEKWFERERVKAKRDLEAESVGTTLERLFDRLSILRNQLIHGGATRSSQWNQRSVRQAAEIMNRLLPLFIDIMRDAPAQDWGRLWYPPGLQGRQRADAPQRRTSGRRTAPRPAR